MFDWLVSTFTEYPYLGVAVVFLVCGLGLPLPEELVLISAGYVCFKGFARPDLMMASCMGAILAGDLLPFFLGRIFGPRILRLRTMRLLLSRQRMAMFDRWFRRRGDLVIFFARFVAGIRMVAYFTAGTMKMPYHRFLILDLTGIALIAPLLVYVGYSFGNVIDDAITKVQKVEQTLLITAGIAAVLVVGWWYLRKRRKAKELIEGPAETFVGPSQPPQAPTTAQPLHESQAPPTPAAPAATAADREPPPLPPQPQPPAPPQPRAGSAAPPPEARQTHEQPHALPSEQPREQRETPHEPAHEPPHGPRHGPAHGPPHGRSDNDIPSRPPPEAAAGGTSMHGERISREARAHDPHQAPARDASDPEGKA